MDIESELNFMIYRRVTIVFILLMGLIIAAAILVSYTPADRADVVVIGAGASGMSAALEAEALGARVILLEKNALCRRQYRPGNCGYECPQSFERRRRI